MKPLRLPIGQLVEVLKTVFSSIPNQAVDIRQQHVLFQAKGNRLVLTASDYDRGTTVVMHLPEPVEEPFTELIPAKFLRDLLSKNVPGHTAELARKNAHVLTLRVPETRSNYTIMAYAGDLASYMNLVEHTLSKDLEASFTFRVNPLQETLNLLSTATAKDESRVAVSAMTSIRMELTEGSESVKLVATDSHRMLYLETDELLAEPATTTRELYFYPHSVRHLKSFAQSGNSDTVIIDVYENRLLMRDEHRERLFVQALPEATRFPNYRKVLDEFATTDACVMIERAALLASLNRLLTYNTKVVFTVQGSVLLMESTGDYGVGEEQMVLRDSAPEITFALNGSFLTETLGKLSDEWLQMEYLQGGSLKPTVWKRPDGRLRFIVMPMTL